MHKSFCVRECVCMWVCVYVSGWNIRKKKTWKANTIFFCFSLFLFKISVEICKLCDSSQSIASVSVHFPQVWNQDDEIRYEHLMKVRPHLVCFFFYQFVSNELLYRLREVSWRNIECKLLSLISLLFFYHYEFFTLLFGIEFSV